jgi:hypothetical protein
MPAGLSGAIGVGEQLRRQESPRRWVGGPLAKQISFMFSPNIQGFQYMVRYYPNLWDCRWP